MILVFPAVFLILQVSAMPKNKPNKGLLKRIRITKSGKVKMGRAFGRHLRSGKSGKLLQKYRKPKYASAADGRRVRAMLFMPLKSQGAARAQEEQQQEQSEN